MNERTREELKESIRNWKGYGMEKVGLADYLQGQRDVLDNACLEAIKILEQAPESLHLHAALSKLKSGQKACMEVRLEQSTTDLDSLPG